MTTEDDRDQEAVAAVLRDMPHARTGEDFLARVNLRIDATAGWLGLADFRAWTLGLLPAAAALVLLAILWPASSTLSMPAQPVVTPESSAASASTSGFSPASYSDWQRDVTANALLDAALHARAKDLQGDVR
jgi:hypothetical protein